MVRPRDNPIDPTENLFRIPQNTKTSSGVRQNEGYPNTEGKNQNINNTNQNEEIEFKLDLELENYNNQQKIFLNQIKTFLQKEKNYNIVKDLQNLLREDDKLKNELNIISEKYNNLNSPTLRKLESKYYYIRKPIKKKIKKHIKFLIKELKKSNINWKKCKKVFVNKNLSTKGFEFLILPAGLLSAILLIILVVIGTAWAPTQRTPFRLLCASV